MSKKKKSFSLMNMMSVDQSMVWIW